MVRIRPAGRQPAGVTMAEVVGVTDSVGEGERYLHEQAVPRLASNGEPEESARESGAASGQCRVSSRRCSESLPIQDTRVAAAHRVSVG